MAMVNRIANAERIRLGSGAFGTVYKTQRNGKTVAVKVISFQRFSGVSIGLALKEVENMQKVKGHPYVVEIYEAEIGDETGDLEIYMEFCNGGDLDSYMKRNNLSAKKCLQFMIQMVEAAEFIHSKGVIHRDIKPANILIKVGVNDDSTIKLADFGVGNLAETMGYPYFDTYAGTRGYMAPEVKSGRYTYSADVYSLGMVFEDMLRNEEIVKLAEQMTSVDPKQRISLRNVKSRLQDLIKQV